VSSSRQPQHIGLLLRQNGARSARRKVFKHHLSQQALRIPKDQQRTRGFKGSSQINSVCPKKKDVCLEGRADVLPFLLFLPFFPLSVSAENWLLL
jgi:hypothetical protein